jgi:hypothetical protein
MRISKGAGERFTLAAPSRKETRHMTMRTGRAVAAIAGERHGTAEDLAQAGHGAFTPVTDRGALAALWRDLERRAEGSFFLSWHWIGAWLDCLPPEWPVWLFSLRESSGQVCALALLVPRSLRRFGLVPARQWLLHEAGIPALDRITIEDNGILTERAGGAALVRRSLDALLRQTPAREEIFCAGLGPAAADIARQAIEEQGGLARLSKESLRFLADLDDLGDGAAYLSRLGRNTRQAIRRAIRLYEGRDGPLRFALARDLGEALDYLERLKRLHQVYWQGRGQPGAFASRDFEAFHHRLIRSAFPEGAIQLCRITAGEREIGYLYNFLWRQRLYSYQSGFLYDEDGRFKPGLVSHYMAVENAIRNGISVYDFLAGDNQQKRSLSTRSERMVWINLSKKRRTIFVWKRVAR